MDAMCVPQWSSSKKLLFQFVFVYLIVYTIPLDNFWLRSVDWMANHLLAISISASLTQSGSGDTTFHYIQLLLFLIVAFASSIVWHLLDKKRQSYDTLFFFLTIIIRYYLAITMIGYGMAKVVKTQFPFPFPARLLQPVGDLSPMGLLWTFMGYSTAYTIFTGLAEIAGAILLLFQRTALLGAIILSFVLLNVVLLNFSYDVPVKIFSCHLLFMSFLIITPHISRLWKFFILQKPVEAVPLRSFTERWKRMTLNVVASLLIGGYILFQITNALAMKRQLEEITVAPDRTFHYIVDTFVLKQDTIPAILNNSVRWKKIILHQKNAASIEYMDGASIYFAFATDTTKRMVTLKGAGYSYDFRYANVDPTHQVWKGLISNDSLKLVVNKIPLDFRLVNRKFHWINEYPYNQ